MLRHFRIWLTQKRIDDTEQLKKQEKFQTTVSKSQERTNTIKWIESYEEDYHHSTNNVYCKKTQ
jgi:hypothetical protein